MSATINWRVGVMECYPTYDQNTDVVFTVHWDCLGSETVSGSTYNGRVYGATGVTFHSGSDFTPYEDLTQPQVFGWVWDAMGSGSKENYENSVQTQINNLINPPIVTPPLPWSLPTIVLQPHTVTVNTGSTATFTISASGKPTPTYQWRFDGTSLTDETSTTLIINDVQYINTGSYDVVVTNDIGTITSNIASLNVYFNPPQPTLPIITEQPSSQTVVVGDGAAFNVNASGESPFTYQWFKDNTEIVGATGNTHIIQTSTLNDAGVYKATVTNIAGTTTSNTATLTVNE
jgi:hypothetical protein